MADDLSLTSCAVYRYCRLLKTGQKRSGLLLSLVDTEGQRGWGEIAPLPGWSQETLSEAARELKVAILPLLAQKKVQQKRVFSTLTRCYPSLQFGVTSALLDLIEAKPALPCAVSGLIQGSLATMRDELLATSFSTVKVKIGAYPLKEARALLQLVLAHRRDIKLRIDLNQKWPVHDALALARALPLTAIDYYEEPFSLTAASSFFPYPLACDESLRKGGLSFFDRCAHLRACVVKPTLTGGDAQIRPLASFCRKKGVDFILSSSYESEIGIAHIAKLCQRLQLPLKPMGLDTCRYFHTPLTTQPLTFEAGKLSSPLDWTLKKEGVHEQFRVSF